MKKKQIGDQKALLLSMISRRLKTIAGYHNEIMPCWTEQIETTLSPLSVAGLRDLRVLLDNLPIEGEVGYEVLQKRIEAGRDV